MDTTGNVGQAKTVYVTKILLTPTSSTSRIVLKNRQAAPQTLLDLRVDSSGDTVPFPFESTPVCFNEGITVDTLTSAIAMIFTSTEGKV